MEYMPDTANQTFGFLYSAGLGFALGILYDFFRILFNFFTGNDKKFLMARDIIYLFVCLVSNFMFLLVMSDGEVLLYIAIGEMIGWSVWYFTISDVLIKPVLKVIMTFRKIIIRFICKIRNINKKLKSLLQKIPHFNTNKEKNSKKDLHNRHEIVYNSHVKSYRRLVFSFKRGDKNGNKNSEQE